MSEPQDWSKWHDERKRFLARDTEGFTKDLAALEAHIQALRAVCPKDEAGVPVTTAFFYLDRLTREYGRFKVYLDLNAR